MHGAAYRVCTKTAFPSRLRSSLVPPLSVTSSPIVSFSLRSLCTLYNNASWAIVGHPLFNDFYCVCWLWRFTFPVFLKKRRPPSEKKIVLLTSLYEKKKNLKIKSLARGKIDQFLSSSFVVIPRWILICTPKKFVDC